jgi:hypothetical protein
MAKILASILRWGAVELMYLSQLPDEMNDRAWGWSLGLLLRVSESGKTQAK